MRRMRHRWICIFVVLAACLAAAGHGAPRALADVNCSDFSTQAAAQAFFLAHGGPAQDPDRLDADHDGIACESLPCPCNTSTVGTPTPTPTATPSPTPTPIPAPTATATPPPEPLGRSVTLGPVRRNANCRINGPSPDRRCTPGARLSKVTASDVCTPGSASGVRDVSQSFKNAVYLEYGIKKHFNGASGEVDHLVSVELGGSNAEANLFPEAATPKPGSHDKDRLENKLHQMVCAGQLALGTAQQAIARNWITAYRKYVGPIAGA